MYDRTQGHAFLRELIGEIRNSEANRSGDWLPAFLFALGLLGLALWQGWIP
jgi:hypothetical protein